MLGLVNPEINNVSIQKQNSTETHNFNCVLVNKSIKRDIDTFYKIFPYKNIGIVFFDEFIKLNPHFGKSLEEVMDKNNTEFTVILVKQSIDDALNNLSNIYAVYLGHFGKLEGKEKVHLIEELTGFIGRNCC